MRLWHYKLIPVLPRQHLLAQWRECCAIASNIANKGTPNHLLVNKVLVYSQLHFTVYCNMILEEMHNRNYKVSESSYTRLVENLEKSKKYFFQGTAPIINKQIYTGWHNDRYLTQCYNNLQEKWDCGGIPTKEWTKVDEMYKAHFKEGK